MLLIIQAGICFGCWVPDCSINFSLSPQDPVISVAPSMPSMAATVTQKSPFYASVRWYASITHTAPTGCVGANVFQASAAGGSGNSYAPVFPGYYGGTLRITARCSAYGYKAKSRTKNFTVKGTQPLDLLIVNYIGSSSSPFRSADLRRIACHESSLTQFLTTGMPKYGPGGDAGIMQRCYFRNNNDLWHWKVNVDAGRSTLITMRNSARNHLDSEVNTQGATPYTNNMWREEGIHRYNAGTGPGNEYREWNTNVGAWEVVDRGGRGGYVKLVTSESASCT